MKPHATVNYVFTHPFEFLVVYHELVMDEMSARGYRVNPLWRDPSYRGKQTPAAEIDVHAYPRRNPIYPEHDAVYLQECMDNLARKGVVLLKDTMHQA